MINFTQIVENQVTTFHLCESCADEKGISNQETLSESPLNNFISQIGSHLKEEKDQEDSKACGSCGSTFKEFQGSGRLGCPQCYFEFEQELGNLLRRIQGSQVHVGKGPRSGASGLSSEESRLLELRKLLEESVRDEEFETAAMLRDEIRALECAGKREKIEGGEEHEPRKGP